MNWLSSNHVHLNCFDKTVFFMDWWSKDSRFIIANQVGVSLKHDAQVYMMLVFVKIERKVSIEDLLVVCTFRELFLKDIYSFPPKGEVHFSIDLLLGIRPISVAPYMIFASEFSEITKQL